MIYATSPVITSSFPTTLIFVEIERSRIRYEITCLCLCSESPKNIGKDNKILSLHIKMWDFLGKGMFFFVLLFHSTNFALQLRVKR